MCLSMHLCAHIHVYMKVKERQNISALIYVVVFSKDDLMLQHSDKIYAKYLWNIFQ